MKYLLVLLVVLVGVWLLLRGRGGDDGSARPGARGTRRGRGGTEEIVECRHCGLHLPRREAIVDGTGRPYCSDEHRLAGPR